MKVHIITQEPFPVGMAATNRIICYAKALLAEGVACEVIIYTRTEVYGRKPKNEEGLGVYEGIPFRYLGGTPLRGSNLFFRYWQDNRDKAKLLLYIEDEVKTGDVVFDYFGRNTNFLTRYVIPSVHKAGAKYVRELCELPYGTGAENYKTRYYRKYCLNKEFPLVDGVVSISEALMELAKQYAPQAKHIKVPILVDYAKFAMEDKSSETEVSYIFHSGTLYQQKDGFVDMVEAFGIANKFSSVPLQFFATGKLEGSLHEMEVRRLIDKYSLQNKLIFTGYLPNEELREYLVKASLVVINKLPTQQNKYCFSTKLGEYMAASKPIIITNIGEAMNWLTDGKDAAVVPPGNIELLAKKIESFVIDREAACRMGANASKTCKSAFDYKVHGPSLVDFFKSL